MTTSINTLFSTSLKARTHKAVGIQTPTGKVLCTECAKRLKAKAVETYYSDSSTDWSITCERCEESILEPRD